MKIKQLAEQGKKDAEMLVLEDYNSIFVEFNEYIDIAQAPLIKKCEELEKEKKELVNELKKDNDWYLKNCVSSEGYSMCLLFKKRNATITRDGVFLCKKCEKKRLERLKDGTKRKRFILNPDLVDEIAKRRQIGTKREK